MSVAQGSKALRAQVMAALKGQLPKNKYSLFDTAQGHNEFTKPTLLIERTTLNRLKEAPMGIHQSTYTLILVSHYKIADAKEDLLDDLCDEVLQALEDTGNPWQTAERSVFNGTNDAYKITITALNQRKKSS